MDLDRGVEQHQDLLGRQRRGREQQHVLAHLGRDVAGECQQRLHQALIEEREPRSADAIAHIPCTLWVLDREKFDQLLFTDKDLAYVILWTFVRTLSERLRETNDKIKGFFALSKFG